MKTTIYWFSGTGNSLHAAKRIVEGLGEAQLKPIATAPPGEVRVDADRVGLAFPVYAWGPPAIVGRFIDRLDVAEDAYVFGLMTYGGDPGGAANRTRKRLKQRGISPAGVYGVKMPENYPPMGGPPREDRQPEMLAAADEKLERIAASVAAAERGTFETGLLPLRLLTPLVHPMFQRYLHRTDRKFSADETCTRCGLCRRICPVDDIAQNGDALPRWLGHCEQCFACLHACPVRAIQYGKKSRRQPRYRHPGVDVEELLPQVSTK